MIDAPPDIRTSTLRERVQAIQDRLQAAGVNAVDMTRAGSLETDFNLPQPMDNGQQDTEVQSIDRLEGEIAAREIHRENTSRFRWFLDGTQKTLPVWRIGVVPIIAGVAVAGIVERDDEGECMLLGSSVSEQVTWFVPTHTQSHDLNSLVDVLNEAGEDVRDPLEGFARNSDDMGMYHALAGNYNRLLLQAHQTAGHVRGKLEEELVRWWDSEIRDSDREGWLVVDGRLSGQFSQAVGFVKDPASQHLFGDEATSLYSLPQGHRTTAYQLLPRRDAEGQDDGELRNQVFTMWYQRMWPAQGLDARHALIRVEANNDITDTEEIDEIATWLFAERIPRPTKDGRWPTLLYPVHHLELMLKRRISALTSGWPS